MDTPRNDQEWTTYIEALKAQLPQSFPERQTPAPSTINRTIDHTLLSESATEQQIDTLCEEAKTYHFASVCVRLPHVARAAQILKPCPEVAVACVVSFPGGMATTAEKVKEAQEAIELGATELDMVMKYPLLKEGRYAEVFGDIAAVRDAARPPITLKVILETSQLTLDEVVAGSLVAGMAGADFVKTSTGFKGEGATTGNVGLMRAVMDLMGKGGRVKASGGVRTREGCEGMLRAGADRIGSSSGVAIMKEVNEGRSIEPGTGNAGY